MTTPNGVPAAQPHAAEPESSGVAAGRLPLDDPIRPLGMPLAALLGIDPAVPDPPPAATGAGGSASDATRAQGFALRLSLLGRARAALAAGDLQRAVACLPPVRGRRADGPLDGAGVLRRLQAERRELVRLYRGQAPAGRGQAGGEPPPCVPYRLPPTPRQAAFRDAVHREVLADVEPLVRDVERAVLEHWGAFDRGCLLAALVQWSRFALNRDRHFGLRLPLAPSARQRREVARRQASSPYAGIYLWACQELGRLQARVTPPRGQGASMYRRGAEALRLLAWACGYAPDLTPPLVGRRLRALHRHMTGAVSQSLRALEDARVLGLDSRREIEARRTTLHPLWSPPPPAPLDADTRRTLAWLCPEMDPKEALRSQAAANAWRRQRNGHLLPELSRAPEPSVAPAATLLDLLPGPLREALLTSPPGPGRTGSPGPPLRTVVAAQEEKEQRAAQSALDALWCWYHAHRTEGYLKPGARTATARDVVQPEAHWIALLKTAADLYDGLHETAFDLLGTSPDQHISVDTYGGHKVFSYDVQTPVRTPIHVACPPRLYAGPQMLGDDPGAPRGLYAAERWTAGAGNASSPGLDVFEKLVPGYFGSDLAAFTARWDDAVAQLAPEVRNDIRAGRRSAVAQLWYVFTTTTPSLAPAIRAALLNAGAGHPRVVVKVDDFLFGLLFVHAVQGAPPPELERFRRAVRSQLYAALQAPWDAARSSGQTPPAWDAATWSALLAEWLTDASDRRSVAGEWRKVFTDAVYLRGLFTRLRGEGLPLPPAIAAWLAGSSGEAPPLVSAALETLVEQVRDVLSDAISSGPRAALHQTILHYVARGLAVLPSGTPGSGAISDVDEPYPEDTFAAAAMREADAGGASIKVNYRYRRVEREDGAPAGDQEMWVEVQFMHLSSVADGGRSPGAPRDPAATPGLFEPETALRPDGGPILGHTGSSGNASTPHAHLQILVWLLDPARAVPGRRRPLALLSPLDFFGPLRWEGLDLTGPWPPTSAA